MGGSLAVKGLVSSRIMCFLPLKICSGTISQLLTCSTVTHETVNLTSFFPAAEGGIVLMCS